MWPADAPGRNRQPAGAVGQSTGQPPNPSPVPHRRAAALAHSQGKGYSLQKSSCDAVSDISVVNSCYAVTVGRWWDSGAGWCGWFAVWSTARLPITAWGDVRSHDFTEPVPGSVRHVSRFDFHVASTHRRRGVDIWGVGASVVNSWCRWFESGCRFNMFYPSWLNSLLLDPLNSILSPTLYNTCYNYCMDHNYHSSSTKQHRQQGRRWPCCTKIGIIDLGTRSNFTAVHMMADWEQWMSYYVDLLSGLKLLNVQSVGTHLFSPVTSRIRYLAVM